MPNTLNIATRCSPLALWQANHIKSRLEFLYPKLTIQLITIVTKGDKVLGTPLAKIGGKALFVKELEEALYDGRADIAVHSLKDVPMDLPNGLMLGAYCERATPTDAFISNKYSKLEYLPQGAIVGTSSLRRQCQVRAYRPDLKVIELRGNVGTRLKKLDAGKYDAIILATSGLQRINLSHRIREEINIEICLPAVGQGALAIECRTNDKELVKLIKPLNDPQSRICVEAERSLSRHLQGGCQVPIAGFASIETVNSYETMNTQFLFLRGRVGSENGKTLLKAEKRISLSGEQVNKELQAKDLGIEIAKYLLTQGAGQILSNL